MTGDIKRLTYEGTPHEWRDWELEAMTDILVEYRKLPKFTGYYQGYAALIDAMKDLGESVYTKPADHDRKAAIKVGAIAMRFLVDVCRPEAWKI